MCMNSANKFLFYVIFIAVIFLMLQNRLLALTCFLLHLFLGRREKETRRAEAKGGRKAKTGRIEKNRRAKTKRRRIEKTERGRA